MTLSLELGDRNGTSLPYTAGTSRRSWPRHGYQGSHVAPNHRDPISLRILTRLQCILSKTVTYKPIEADPVRVRLAARAALHLESVEVGVFLGVRGLEVGHSILESQKNPCPKAYYSLNMSIWHAKDLFFFFFCDGAGRAQKNDDLEFKIGGEIINIPFQLSLKDQGKHFGVGLDLRLSVDECRRIQVRIVMMRGGETA